MSDAKRIPTDAGPALTQTPFASLSSHGLPPGPDKPSAEITGNSTGTKVT